MNALFKGTIASLLTLASMVAVAKDTSYPDKPIKIVVPLAPGGSTDFIARILGKHLTEALGQPVVVENKTGAGGVIGLNKAISADPDGYTLFVGNVSTNALDETVYANALPIKPTKGLIPITMLVTIPHALVSSAKITQTSVGSFVDYAKHNPGKANYGTPGVGSYPSIDMLNFAKAAGVKMLEIPYPGGVGNLIKPLIANDIQLTFINVSSVLSYIRSGSLKVLAVTTNKRLPELPDAPTIAEAGYPGIGTNAWQGAFVTAGTPPEIVDKLHKAITQVMHRKDVEKQLGDMMITVETSPSPEEFKKFVDSETKRWGNSIKEFNIHVGS